MKISGHYWQRQNESKPLTNSRDACSLMLTATFQSHQVTNSHRKTMSIYHFLETLIDQTCTQCRKQIQHIPGEFWSHWRNEFLQNLQIELKWNTRKQDFKVGDILLKEDFGTNKWPMAKVMVKIEPDSNGDMHVES